MDIDEQHQAYTIATMKPLSKCYQLSPHTIYKQTYNVFIPKPQNINMIMIVSHNLPTGNGGEGHTGQQRPGGVIGLLHVGRTQDTTAQSMRSAEIM